MPPSAPIVKNKLFMNIFQKIEKILLIFLENDWFLTLLQVSTIKSIPVEEF